MTRLNRRRFLAASTRAAVALLGADKAWGLTQLVPQGDPLAAPRPYRGWEDIYARQWTWDHVGYASHCVNCGGNCAFRIYVKDGIVVREEQVAQYPSVHADVPDTNPRGCQKGAIHSAAMYDADRLRFPMKRTGERGESKWRRITWDEAATEIADRIIDIYEQYGPGHLMTQWGSGVVSSVPWAAALRFASLLGGVQNDLLSDVGDMNTGAHLAYGDLMQGFTSDAWYDADYIVLSMINPSVTRIPDAHYIWEARYRGARVLSVAPDYNPSSTHADVWLPIKPGTDPFFYMSLVQVILAETLVDRAFVKEQTDLPLLVRRDNGKLLREADLRAGGRDDVFFFWDQSSQRATPARGCTGSEDKTIALDGADPALEGEFEVDGIAVAPAYTRMYAEAMRYDPELTAAITGVHPDIVRAEARLIAAARKLCVLDGFAVGKFLNGIYTTWAQALLCALTGHGGPRGGIDTSWLDWGWIGVQRLSFLEFTKFPRLATGGLSEFMHGRMYEDARELFDPVLLRQRVGFDVDELVVMAHESMDRQWMPHYGPIKGMILVADNKFRRNKGGERYRERILEEASELFVSINTRMESTNAWADYLLPAASYYEKWDLRLTPTHRHVNVFTAPVAPLGEAMPEWEIMALLTKKIQERARARGITGYPDGDVTRSFDTIYDDYTLGGTLTTAEQAAGWLVRNSPEIAGASLDEGARTGFFTVRSSPFPTHTTVHPDAPINPWEHQVLDKKPYPTLSGRITFYCDHDWFMKLGSTVPTARHNAGRECTRYPLSFYTPHTRWGIHSNWRSNRYMLRLQRGEPNVYLSPRLAAERGIGDGDRVRVFNAIGDFFAQAKYCPGLPGDAVMMEHAWESYQMEGRKMLNNVVASLLQPLELVGNWGHLKYQFLRWNQNQLSMETGVDVEPARID
ncbi:MAG: molybdopterin-dependent oxidoreductase [Gammaproteobacteria bacterium]|nr:molybdopterin-dependent oxidoreductase [Gammaproteobacteria bacterium]